MFVLGVPFMDFAKIGCIDYCEHYIHYTRYTLAGQHSLDVNGEGKFQLESGALKLVGTRNGSPNLT